MRAKIEVADFVSERARNDAGLDVGGLLKTQE
jgi:hypothetical protein